MRTILSLTLLLITIALKSQDYTSICQKGIDYIKENNYAQAVQCFEEAVACSTGNSEKTYALANLAYSYQMLGELPNVNILILVWKSLN